MDGSLYPQTRKKLSDAERAALAQKLDDELDEFMEQMATKKRDREAENPETKKPFDFDEWCKEIEQHPCFMTDKTNINDCLNGKYGDTIAAMQAMKYDEEDSTEDKQITAEKQKAEGNKHFQNKKYRWAIECYTKGIKARCFDRKLNGILYSNRAASNKYLENYRSAIKDAIQARRFDPTNLKATIHAVESLLKLGYGKEAVDLIDQSKKLFALTKETEDGGNVVEGETKLLKDLDNLYKDAEVKYAVQRKQNKQRREEEKADLTEKTKLLAALKERKLNMAPRVPFDHPELFDYARIRVQLAQVSHEHDKVTLDWERNLVWPIMLQYPEVGYTDVITEVSETCGVEELMDSVLAEQAPFDPDHLYKPRSVRYFVTSEYDEFLIEVKKKLTFGQILSAPNYQIRHGLPTILIFSSKHVMEKLQKIGSSDGFDHFIIIAVYIGANRLPEPCSPVSPNAVKATCIDPRTIDLTMQRLSRLVDNVCLLEPEDPETFSPLEKKIRRGLGLSFRGLVAVFFAWHVFDFLFSAIWMHGYVWSLNLPIDLDLSDKSAGSIVYHQKNVVGAFERIYHAFGAVVGIFLMMLCSGFASGKDMKVWELVKLATGLGFLVAAVRGCQIKHRLFSALHEGFYTVFLVFFVGVILAIQSAAPAKENSQPEAVKEEEKKNN